MLRLAFVLLALLLPALASAATGTIRRFALVAGANNGGVSTVCPSITLGRGHDVTRRVG